MDARIVAALAEPPPPDTASDLARERYAALQLRITEYSALTSHSMEGSQYEKDPAVAAARVMEYHAAYLKILAAGTAAPGTNPALLATPRGYTVDFSHLSLHRL